MFIRTLDKGDFFGEKALKGCALPPRSHSHSDSHPIQSIACFSRLDLHFTVLSFLIVRPPVANLLHFIAFQSSALFFSSLLPRNSFSLFALIFISSSNVKAKCLYLFKDRQESTSTVHSVQYTAYTEYNKSKYCMYLMTLEIVSGMLYSRVFVPSPACSTLCSAFCFVNKHIYICVTLTVHILICA